MPKRCVAGGCGNNASKEVSLHVFPPDKKLRAAWTKAVKVTKDGWEGPTKYSVLCSDHFRADSFDQETSDFALGMMADVGIPYRRSRRLRDTAIPTLFTKCTIINPPKREKTQTQGGRGGRGGKQQTDRQSMIKSRVYDNKGRLLTNGKDMCDCLDIDCMGCFNPCPECGSRKCGVECRCDRKWLYEQVEVEGGAIIRNKFAF